MQEREAYIPSEQSLDVHNGGTKAVSMEDILSHRLPSLYRTAYRFLGNSADAEDAVQDALLAAYKHLDQFKGQAQISTWLTVIVCNCARMQLRRRPRNTHLSLDEPIGGEQKHSISERLADSRPSPEDQCQEMELKERLRDLTVQLSPTLLRTFQLRDVAGLSVQETASILDLPAGTVKAQSSRARAKLTRSMRRVSGPRHRATKNKSGITEK